jgi:hypothetical protein
MRTKISVQHYALSYIVFSKKNDVNLNITFIICDMILLNYMYGIYFFSTTYFM